MSDRTFTLDEAQSLLPVLESLLRAAIGGKKIMEEVEAEMQSLNHRIFLNGGTHVDVVAVARRKAERVKAEQRAKDALAEIDSIGVQVKDLDIGLLDFPCEVDGRVVLLCGGRVKPPSPTGTAPTKASPDASRLTSASRAQSGRTSQFSVLGKPIRASAFSCKLSGIRTFLPQRVALAAVVP